MIIYCLILGLEICVTRLNQNYKALYRLAHLYFNYKQKRDLTRCKQLLLSEYKCKDGTCVFGLFTDRKANNFFNVSENKVWNSIVLLTVNRFCMHQCKTALCFLIFFYRKRLLEFYTLIK